MYLHCQLLRLVCTWYQLLLHITSCYRTHIMQYSSTVRTWYQWLPYITSSYRTHTTMILYSTVQQYIPGASCCFTLPVATEHTLRWYCTVQSNSTYLVPTVVPHYQFLKNTNYNDIVQCSSTVRTWCQLLLHITSCYRTHITMILYSAVQRYIPGTNGCLTLIVATEHTSWWYCTVQFNSMYLVPTVAPHYQLLQNTHHDNIVQYSSTVHTWCQ